jgi:hypothetical protein
MSSSSGKAPSEPPSTNGYNCKPRVVVIIAENELLWLASFEIMANAPTAIGYYKVSAVVLIDAVGV